MKKYFISYRYQKKNTCGFGNLIRTSLNKFISFSEIKKWEEEISEMILKDVIILNFQEVKDER